MERVKIKEILSKIETSPKVFGVIGNERPTAINALAKSVPIGWFEQFAKLMRQEVLEEAAEHFDKRGKYNDGTWCDGGYEPCEPGEILRSLKEVD